MACWRADAGGRAWDIAAVLATEQAHEPGGLIVITKEEYINDPCGSLPTAYWKRMAYPVPENVKIFHERDHDGSPNATKYFRLLHNLRETGTSKHEGFVFVNVDLYTQKGLVAQILSECYDTEYSLDFIDGMIKTNVFDNDLWLLAVDKSTMKPAALGIADFDPEIKEGSLEWIQVLPEYRKRGLGQAMVNELLNRLRTKASFVTVSGQVDNVTKPEMLYRKCGFTGDDIWCVVHTE